MALEACRECGAQISTEAKTCPSCGVKDPTKRPSDPKQSTLTKQRTLSPRLKLALKVLFGLAIVNIIYTGLFGERRASQPASSANEQAAASPVNACFDRGYNVAKVYFANVKSAIEVGANAHEMMEVACRDAVSKIGTNDCLGQCEAGFKHIEKSWWASSK